MATRYSHHLVIGVQLRAVTPKKTPGKFEATCRVAIPPQLSPTKKTVLEIVEFDLQVQPGTAVVCIPDIAAGEALSILSAEAEAGTTSGGTAMILEAAVPAEITSGTPGEHTGPDSSIYVGPTHYVARNHRKLASFLESLKAGA